MREHKFRLYNKSSKQMFVFDPKWGNFGQGGGWVGGVLLEDYEREGLRFAPSNRYQLEPEGCEWMEYIDGLLDKNDREICEDDIVSVLEQWINKNDETDINEENTYNLQVCFVNYEWELIYFYKNENGIIMPHQPIIKLPDYREGYSWGNGLEIWGHSNFEYKQRFKDFTVIGNIHQNPELLEGDHAL